MTTSTQPRIRLSETFGVRSMGQVGRDLRTIVRGSIARTRFQWDLRSAGLLRPRLALPAYVGLAAKDGLAPIYNLFDRAGGGRRFTQRVSRGSCRDFRGGRLTYDEHDGTDFVCPVGTPIVSAAPGVVVLVRDQWLRGGLTVGVDHGDGVLTQYTHCSRAVAAIGQPVRRGETVALSGAAGYDLLQFFPWVPPHVHFMSWVDGAPVDPYLTPEETRRAGTWLEHNEPRPSGPSYGDAKRTDPSPVLPAALHRVAEACVDEGLQQEMDPVRQNPAALAALLEDAMHHDRWAWPKDWQPEPLRPAREGKEPGVRFAMPLPGDQYRGARFGDSAWSRPPRG